MYKKLCFKKLYSCTHFGWGETRQGEQNLSLSHHLFRVGKTYAEQSITRQVKRDENDQAFVDFFILNHVSFEDLLNLHIITIFLLINFGNLQV